jgi:hypothetical protein
MYIALTISFDTLIQNISNTNNMDLFIARVSYHNLEDKKITETYLVNAASYTEAEARTLEYLDELTPSPVTIKSLKPLGVNDTMGLDVDSTSAGYYIVSVVDEVDGKKVTRKTLVKELSIMEASEMASDGRIQDVTDARVLDIVDIIKAA